MGSNRNIQIEQEIEGSFHLCVKGVICTNIYRLTSQEAIGQNLRGSPIL